MPRSRVSALLLMLALPAAVALAAAKPYTISAARKDEAGKWRQAEVLEETRLGVIFEIKFLDPAAARAAVRTGLGKDLNLLPGRIDEHKPGFLVFVLQVNNNGQQDVYFNPAQARMTSDSGDVKFALDYSALYEVARKLGSEAPSLDELAAITFDRAVTIRAGGRVQGPGGPSVRGQHRTDLGGRGLPLQEILREKGWLESSTERRRPPRSEPRWHPRCGP